MPIPWDRQPGAFVMSIDAVADLIDIPYKRDKMIAYVKATNAMYAYDIDTDVWSALDAEINAGTTSLYVSDADGNDANDGSISAPFKTIQAAVNKARTLSSALGVSIYIGLGNYIEVVDLKDVGAKSVGNIHLLGASMFAVSISSVGASGPVTDMDRFTLRGVEIDSINFSAAGPWGVSHALFDEINCLGDLDVGACKYPIINDVTVYGDACLKNASLGEIHDSYLWERILVTSDGANCTVNIFGTHCENAFTFNNVTNWIWVNVDTGSRVGWDWDAIDFAVTTGTYIRFTLMGGILDVPGTVTPASGFLLYVTEGSRIPSFSTWTLTATNQVLSWYDETAIIAPSIMGADGAGGYTADAELTKQLDRLACSTVTTDGQGVRDSLFVDVPGGSATYDFTLPPWATKLSEVIAHNPGAVQSNISKVELWSAAGGTGTQITDAMDVDPAHAAARPATLNRTAGTGTAGQTWSVKATGSVPASVVAELELVFVKR